jgi:molecular chaperone GrpE
VAEQEKTLRQEEAAEQAASTDGVHPEPAAEATAQPETTEQEAAGRVEEDLDELRARAAERDEYLALAQRTQADFENYRKRMSRETAIARDRGVKQVVEELLPALDNFERALAAAEAEEADSEHHLTKGIRLVQQDLVNALARVGIESFSPKGEVFDPTQHEAMAQQPVEGTQAGTVVEVYQQGYRLGGNVIRPARVVVAA